LKSQSCQVWIHDTNSGDNTLLFETNEILLEAPNWNLRGDALILNGAGVLWQLPLAEPTLHKIEINSVPPLNNDHVLDPDGKHIFLSAYDDWQLYRAPLKGGTAKPVTGKEGPDGLLHFLHGVSPEGQRLAFVGVEAEENEGSLRFISAEIYTIKADGSDYRKITHRGVPSDGPEYSPDGKWLYFNTEAFSKNSQIARMRPDGSELTRLTFGNTVDWFPHLSLDGHSAVYLAYPTGTKGHPADLEVELMVVQNGNWQVAMSAAKLFGGQGTINVNSWSPDSRRFAYVAYPLA
jgi:dipeptidyl aminopeptidase/acylaminoacyl peptidase